MSKEASNKSKILQSLSRTNWKAILFFTSFTFLLWLILQFTKTHKIEYVVNVEFSDVPVKEVLAIDQIKLSTTIQQTGFALFKKQFTDNTISLSLSDLQKKDSVYIFQSSQFNSQIAQKMKLSAENFSINDKQVAIPFSTKSSKKIPLQVDVKINYAKSYASYKGIEIDKDSIEIAGPSNEIADITKIETEALELKELKNNTSGKLKFLKPFSDKVILDFNELNYEIQVEKFTEKSFLIPIQLKNSPTEYKVRLIPEQINISFQSSLEDMENINVDDFQVVCDFDAALNEASLLVPKLVKQPKKAIRIQLEPNRVEYILLK